MDSGVLRVARGGCGADTPPLAARPDPPKPLGQRENPPDWIPNFGWHAAGGKGPLAAARPTCPDDTRRVASRRRAPTNLPDRVYFANTLKRERADMLL